MQKLRPTQEQLDAKRKQVDELISDAIEKSGEKQRLLIRSLPRYTQTLLAKKVMGKLRKGEALKLKCLDCSNYQIDEIRFCPVTQCPLHDLRPYQVRSDRVDKEGV